MIDQAHIRRVAPASPASPASPGVGPDPQIDPQIDPRLDPLADPSPTSQDTSGQEADQEADPSTQGNIAGLSDLSGMMRQEAQKQRDSQFDDYETLGTIKEPPRKPLGILPGEAGPDNPPAKIDKPARTVRNGYLLVGASALALAVLGAGVWFTTSVVRNIKAAAVPAQTEPVEPPEPVYEGPEYDGLPLAASQILTHHPWERPNRSYEPVPREDESVGVAGDKLTSSADGGIDYIGRVVTQRPGVIIDAELTVSLVNRQGLEKARTVTPIAMVSPDQPMLFRLPIPADLDPTALTALWSIKVNQSLDPAIPIEHISIEQEGHGADTMTRVTIENDKPKTIQRAVLVITAWDSQDELLRRWKVHWDMPIKPQGVIEFYTRTAVVPTWRIDRWSATASGE